MNSIYFQSEISKILISKMERRRQRPLINSGFLSEMEKVSIFGMKIITLIIGTVLLLCFLILAYVIWSDSLTLNEIAMENNRIENTLGKILYKNIDIKHHIKQINNEISSIEAEYKEIEGKASEPNPFGFSKKIRSVPIRNSLLDASASNKISDWIDINHVKLFSLLYKASRDGDTANAFRRSVKDISPTISIFKTNEALFGGYTTKSWIGSDEEHIQDDKAFLFSLDKNKKYPIKNPRNAIYRGNSTLGYYGNEDLIINNKCLAPSTIHYSYFPNNFGNNSDEYELTNGKRRFSLIDVEVYQVID